MMRNWEDQSTDSAQEKLQKLLDFNVLSVSHAENGSRCLFTELTERCVTVYWCHVKSKFKFRGLKSMLSIGTTCSKKIIFHYYKVLNQNLLLV